MVTRMMLVDDGDLLAMMLTMIFFIYLFLINVTNLFSISSFKKYLHNTVLYMFPFASDTSAYHNLNVLLHLSITSIL